jgi:GT2 family glycosyltransferase
VVVVDNSSPDASGAVVRLGVIGARMFFNSENRGFGGGMNQGISEARSPYVLLLNPDVEVGPGWLEPLLMTLDTRPECAAVSPLLQEIDGTVQEFGAVVDGTGHTHRIGGTDWPLSDAQLRPATVDYASAACLLVRRSAFESIGGFDPIFWPAYFEDVDLAFRLRLGGWTIRVEPASAVVHVGGGTDSRRDRTRLFHLGLAAFSAKWAAELRTRPDHIEDPDTRRRLEQLAGSGRRLLDPAK